MHREVLGKHLKNRADTLSKCQRSLKKGRGGPKPTHGKSQKYIVFLKILIEATLRGGRGGGTGSSCSPEINWLVPLFIKNLFFLCSMQFPNIVFLPLKIWPLICNPEINASFPSAIFHCSQKSQTEPQYWVGTPPLPQENHKALD